MATWRTTRVDPADNREPGDARYHDRHHCQCKAVADPPLACLCLQLRDVGRMQLSQSNARLSLRLDAVAQVLHPVLAGGEFCGLDPGDLRGLRG